MRRGVREKYEKLTVGMSGTIDVTIMTRICLVFNVRGVDGNSASFLLWSFIDLRVVGKLGAPFYGEDLSDCSSQGCLPMVNMA
jgi:hypothetical protein